MRSGAEDAPIRAVGAPDPPVAGSGIDDQVNKNGPLMHAVHLIDRRVAVLNIAILGTAALG
jgi:hypothetical protein